MNDTIFAQPDIEYQIDAGGTINILEDRIMKLEARLTKIEEDAQIERDLIESNPALKDLREKYMTMLGLLK